MTTTTARPLAPLLALTLAALALLSLAAPQASAQDKPRVALMPFSGAGSRGATGAIQRQLTQQPVTVIPYRTIAAKSRGLDLKTPEGRVAADVLAFAAAGPLGS